MRFIDLGVMDFEEVLVRQQRAVDAIAAEKQPERVYLVEHPHTFTIGRCSNSKNLLAAHDWNGNAIELIPVGRGGDITYHGPGQLVGYLHLDLRRRGRDVHRFLRDLEKSLVLTLHRFGVAAYTRPGLTGVWSSQGKLASIGVAVRRWVTMHGFALNVSTELRYFHCINACGMPGRPMTSVTQVLRRPVDLANVKAAYQQVCDSVFEGGMSQQC